MEKNLLKISLFALSMLTYNVTFSQCDGIISPPNESQDCCNATVLYADGATTCLTDQLNQTYNVLGSSGNAEGTSPPCWTAGDHTNVSYAIVTPTVSGNYNFTSASGGGGSVGIAMALYTGTCGGGLTYAGYCDDDYGTKGGSDHAEMLGVPLVAGTTYYIAYSGSDAKGDPGELGQICVRGGAALPPPANDMCVNAEELTEGTSTSGSLINATSTTTAPDFDEVLCSGSTENNIWFTFEAPADGDYYFIIDNANCSRDAGFQVSIFDLDCAGINGLYPPANAALPSTTDCEAYANTATNDNFETTVTMTAGQEITITVDGQSGTECVFDALMSDVPIAALGTVNFALSVEAKDTGNKLKWHNNQEANNTQYVIERSFNGVSYSELATVNGIGTSADAQVYTYIDETAKKGAIAYYRVKLDKDDKYSNVSVVGQRVIGSNTDVSIYPSPTTIGGDVLIGFNTVRNTSYDVKLYNVSGKLVFENNVTAESTTHQASIPTDSFDAGMYYVLITNEGGSTVGQNSFLIKE